MFRGIRLSAFIAGLAGAAAPVCAQEGPLTASATFYTGYYASNTKGDANQSLQFVPFGAKFDINGYVISPDLVSFSVQPEVTAGPQASEAGIQGGNGIRLRITILRHRAFPLTLRYSNVDVQDAYFGGLSQLSGYRLHNRNKDAGITWEFTPKKGISVIFDGGIGSVDSQSNVIEIPAYLSHQKHLNLDGKVERAGWTVEGFAHRQFQSSNLLEAIDGTATTGTLRQDVSQYQLALRRSLGSDSEIYIDGGAQSTSNLLFTLPIDLSSRYAGVNLRLRQRHRWKTAVRAGYTSNLASQLLAQATSTLSGPGTVASGTTVLEPFSRVISNLNINATTTADLGAGFGLFAGAEHNEILTAAASNAPPGSKYTTANAGITYAHHFSVGNVSAQYSRDQGRGSVTGQTGTISGQSYSFGLQRSTANSIGYDFAVHGAEQRVVNIQPLSSHNLSAEAGISFPVHGDLSTRIGGGWQRSNFINTANEFKTNGYTARLSVEHPKYQLSAFVNDSLSNSLPLYNSLLGIDLGGILLPQRIVPSDYRLLGVTMHSNPFRRAEVGMNWTRSRQHLDGMVSNQFELRNAYLIYRFRKLQMESGYIWFRQTFAFYPSSERERFYVRFQRTVRLR